MEDFKQYHRSQIAELRPYKDGEILSDRVSISVADLENGSPLPGDMIARNPKNHKDQWLVAKKYFEDNFEPLSASQAQKAPSSDLDFGQAIDAMKQGLRVARSGWNGKGMHVFLENDFSVLINIGSREIARKYEPVICMWTAQQTTQPGWLASQADILARDWFVLQS